jgi:hypothetical protein
MPAGSADRSDGVRARNSGSGLNRSDLALSRAVLWLARRVARTRPRRAGRAAAPMRRLPRSDGRSSLARHAASSYSWSNAAELVVTAHAIKRNRVIGQCRFVQRRWLRERQTLAKRAVMPVRVVMRRMDVDDALEPAAADDQKPVEALAAPSVHPALGVGSRPRHRTGASMTRMPSEQNTSRPCCSPTFVGRR